MHQIQAIYNWLKNLGPGWVESAPYEELFERYPKEKINEKRRIYEEFSRRLSRLVYRAAQDYVTRKKRKDLAAEAEKLTNHIFCTFVPEMAAGEPAFGLRRFAICIRSVLDDKAFECIARTLYYQLPLYHVTDDEQRRFLAAMFQEQELAKPEDVSHVKQLSERFQVSTEHAEAVIKSGLRHLKKVIAKDFKQEELSKLTEGYVIPE